MTTVPRTAYELFNMLPEGTLVQLINDKIIVSPPYTAAHQLMVGFIATELYGFVKRNKLGKTYLGPLDTELNKKNVFQPDILFISNERKNIIKEDRIYGAPDLIIEVLSKETIKYDEGEKKDCYIKYGVKEYWMIDMDDFNKSKGYYMDNLTYKKPKDGTIRLKTIDLVINLNEWY